MKKSKEEIVYVLRTCNEDLTAYNGFQWPAKGKVSAPDWSPAAVCGQGLHGLLRGEGEVAHLTGSKWLVVAVVKSEIVDLNGKVKFPKGKVVYCGTRDEAVKLIQEKHPEAAPCYGRATAGDSGTATAGSYGRATAGDSGTATAGDSGTATAGSYGRATAGDSGTATAGDSGTATAGSYGKATAGSYGRATAGSYGKATAGDSGTATAGNKGLLMLLWWDSKESRQRIETAYVGENGIEADVLYKLDPEHRFVRA